jgi:hypothetical protein
MVGRRLYLRVHLGVLILQSLQKFTDRGCEESIKNTPRFQIFCGLGIISNWKCPDHTKIEVFRNRLAPETHRLLNNYVLQLAASLGLADPKWMDIDSTIQQANMSYPADSTIMRKLAIRAKKVINYFKEKMPNILPKGLSFDIKTINGKAKEYFFMAKNVAREKKNEVFQELHQKVKEEMRPTVEFLSGLKPQIIKEIPWNIARDIQLISEKSWRYLLDVAHFIRTGSIKTGKILAFHLSEVACFNKNKPGKEREFGRQYQLGRIGGNFVMVSSSTDVRMDDKSNVLPTIEEHQEIFGAGVLREVGADKGYHKAENIKGTKAMGINADGLQQPVNSKSALPLEVVAPLRDRRAGIEPLIGHVKSFGLGKSKMKSDNATLASGYRSVLGFNLHQMVRRL